MKVILIVVALLTAACTQSPTGPSSQVNDQVPCVDGYKAVPNVGCVAR